MPCSVSQEEIEYYERADNLKKYGKKVRDYELVEEVACQLARFLYQRNLLNEAPKLVQKWAALHMSKDMKAGRSWEV